MVEIIVTVVLEAVKCLAGPAQRQFSYLCCYSKNIKKLKKEIEEMKGEMAGVPHKDDPAIVQAQEFVDTHEANANKRCFMGLCPNLMARFQLGKDAVGQLKTISKLRETGRFGRYRENWFASSKDYETFESRNSTLEGILSALEDPDVNMLGLYGMGGIGKTTLAKGVARQVESKFDEIMFVEVSHSPDIGKIQEKMADVLHLEFQEKDESARASQLCNRLKKEKRVLVILDNIWKKLDLQEVGIPYGDDHRGCKVLLTARSLDVLSEKMASQRNFPVGILNEKEAWSLFKKMAGGEYIEGRGFKSVAAKVAEKCAGLPVSIVTVASALRDKEIHEWRDANRRLRHPLGENFQNIQAAAYKAIEFSYNKLEDRELKKIFLLIAYADFDSVDELLMYGMGLGLFGDISHMEEARDRVLTLVGRLKASCMLLDHMRKKQEWFSMHDVVRDVAISIASGEENVLTVENGELNNQLSDESRAKSYTSIVLLDVKTNIVLPEELDCSQIRLFRVRGAADRSSSLTNPNDFFTKMKHVRVLDLTFMHLAPRPSSLGLLTNLRTLRLCRCELQDMAVVGNFKKLEILCLDGSEIKKLPEEVDQLTRLKVLDLRWCWGLKVIPPNVLSKLSCLEELYIGSFVKWGEEVKGVKNASLNELKHLPNLTSLELQIIDVNTLPRDFIFEKLERFNIVIGVGWVPTGSRALFKLELTSSDIRLKDGLVVKLKGVEDLRLDGLQDQDVKYLVDELVDAGSLQQLKHLSVKGHIALNSMVLKESMSDMQSNEIVSDDSSFFFKEEVAAPNLESLTLVSINVERIWQNQLAAMSSGIQNLKDLNISGCRNLKCLFPTSILSCCVQLQKLLISNCPLLEVLVIVDPMETTKVIFPPLQSLGLMGLRKLTSFCTEDVLIEFPCLKKLEIDGCPKLMMKYKNSEHNLTKEVVIPNLETLSFSSVIDEGIWQSQLAAMSRGVQSLTNLRTLHLGDCKLQDMAVVGNFKHLEILQLRGSKIKKLPEEVGQLTRLKALDLRLCWGLEVIPPNVLSKLSCLEELYMSDGKVVIGGRGFDKWGEEVEGVKNASLDELKHLPNLTSLQLWIHDVNTLPPGGLFFEKLERFNIGIGVGQVPNYGSRAFELELTGTNIRLKDVLVVQLKGVENLKLSGLQDQDVKYLIDELVNAGSLQQLKRLDVKGRDTPNPKIKEESTSDMQRSEIISDNSSFILEKAAAPNLESLYLHSINVERIWQQQLATMSNGFQNLKDLNISACWNLKCLFSTSILCCCVQLQNLVMRNCPLLEELVTVDPTKMKKVIFNQLQSLKLENLKNLTSFCTGDVLIEFPSLQELEIEECPKFMEKYKSSNHDFTKEVWVPNLDYLKVEEKNISWLFQSPEDSFRKLTFIDVLLENVSTIILSLDFLQRFHAIKFLVISGGTFKRESYENGFTAVIRKDGKFYDMKSILKPSAIFNDLETLEFDYLECDNLINLVPSSATFHNLTTLVLDGCEGFKKPLTSSTAKSLVRLREMRIEDSDSIIEIVTDDEGDNATKDEIIFKELKWLELCDLKNLISFYSGNCSLKFPSLETLVVKDCPNMKVFSWGELSTPKLLKVLSHKWFEEDGIWEGNLNTTILHQYLETEESFGEDLRQLFMQPL